jgi:hypothetical protein
MKFCVDITSMVITLGMTTLHGVTSHRILIFIAAAVMTRTSFQPICFLRIKNAILLLVTPCISEGFGGTYRLHIQVRRVSKVRKQQKQAYFFNPEDEGNVFLRNVGLSLNYTVLQSRRPYTS